MDSFKSESGYKALLASLMLSALGLCNSAYAATIKPGDKSAR